MKQKRHSRVSKLGKVFMAGTRVTYPDAATKKALQPLMKHALKHKALKGVTQIRVMPKPFKGLGSLNAGVYLGRKAQIVAAMPESFKKGAKGQPPSKWRVKSLFRVLFHEAGHHRDRDSWKSDDEGRQDKYADRIMRSYMEKALKKYRAD